MMRRPGCASGRRRLCGALVLLLATPGHAAKPPGAASSVDYRQAPKLALVVGNTRYEGAYSLRNAEQDARLIATRLRAAGYATTLLLDADRATLYAGIGNLADQLSNGGVGAFYFAGHGMEIKGRNYLIPGDAPMSRPGALAQAAIPVDYLIERLKDSGAHLSLILLDACRNEPGVGKPLYRGLDKTGFVPDQPANGMLVAYATQPGERALDGSGKNGPFALALANWMTRPGLSIENAMKRVMVEVRAVTHDEQRPWVATSMVGNFAMVPAAGSPALLVRPNRINSDGTARGAPTIQTDSDMLQWFQNQSVADQMLLTSQIIREAKALNQNDLGRLKRKAKGGDIVAQAVLGSAYHNGFGIGQLAVRSNLDALTWLRMAAAQKLPFALNELGEMHFLGHGVTRSNEKAITYFEAAAVQGYPPAKLNLLQAHAESGTIDPRELLGKRELIR